MNTHCHLNVLENYALVVSFDKCKKTFSLKQSVTATRPTSHD